MPTRAVVFDVGETLVDETRIWSEWADALGITRLTFLAVLGAAIERGRDHLEPFRILRPDLDLDGAMEARARHGGSDTITPADFYPDAEPCLRALHAAGFRLGIVGNQPSRAEAALRELDLPLDLVASSASWGVQKPDLRFFERVAAELDLPPREVAYVGDRLDNDVRPAAAAGMVAVFVRRGPWAWIQAGPSDPEQAALVVESLAELPEALAAAATR